MCNCVSILLQSVFRLTSREGIEYLIQAVNNEERDKWTNDIAECIRKLEARDRVMILVSTLWHVQF